MTSALRAMIAVLDEAALEALAPKGLVRRALADVDAGRATLLTESDGEAELAVDGETVRLGAAGPRASSCSCPAPSFCRHRLAALILLRNGALEAPHADIDISNEPSPPAEPADWSALAASFTEERLSRFAGKAGWRHALERWRSIPGVEVLPLGGTLQVRLGPGEEPVIFLATGGLDDALTKAPEKIRKPHVVVAALAVRRSLGMADFILSEAPADGNTSAATTSPKLLADVQDLLCRLYRAALAFAPLALEDEIRRFAVAGRVEALPRLSRLLRSIAGGMAAIRRREIDADPDRLLALLSEAYALTVSLHALDDPTARNAAVSVARQRYEPIGALELYGLGAQLWETSSGAHGVTAYFHDPAGRRDLQLTQARPDKADVAFSAQAAFDHPVWGVAMRKLSTGSISLREASVSPSGRLSTTQSTAAQVSPWTPRPDAVRGWSCAADDWRVLEDRLRETFSPALTRPRIDDTPVILIHSRFAPLRFDELTQSLIWPIADRDGRWIGLTLSYEGVERTRIENLERIAQTARFWAVMAIAKAVDDRFELRPYGLLGDELLLLDFDPSLGRQRTVETSPSLRPSLLDRLKGARGQPQTGPLNFIPATCTTDRALAEAWALLMRHAELGHSAPSRSLQSEAAAIADRLDAVGLAPVGGLFAALSQTSSSEKASLAAAWAVRSIRQARSRLSWMMQ